MMDEKKQIEFRAEWTDNDSILINQSPSVKPNTVDNTNTLLFVPDNPSYALKGWICPKCGAGVSPYTNVCPNCTPPQKIEITC